MSLSPSPLEMLFAFEDTKNNNEKSSKGLGVRTNYYHHTINPNLQRYSCVGVL